MSASVPGFAPSQVDRPGIARAGYQLATICAALWIALGLDSILRPVEDDRRDAFCLVPIAFTAAVICILHLLHRAPARRLESISFRVLAVSTVLIFGGNIGLLTNTPVLIFFTVPWGILGWSIALLAYGVAVWRARLYPWWMALAIMLLEPLSVIGGLLLAPLSPIHDRGTYSGALAKGLAMLAIAGALRHRRAMMVHD